jgi:DNA-binding transcriptional regulator YiaG
MSNIATLLKQEITRLVRKELKAETETLRKASSRYRAEIAELKRRIADLERQLKSVARASRRTDPAAGAAEGPAAAVRFSADGLKKHRARLGLSAPALAGLLGVSSQTIYNWEAGTSRPSKDQVVKIAQLRKMGKRAAQAALQAKAA